MVAHSVARQPGRPTAVVVAHAAPRGARAGHLPHPARRAALRRRAGRLVGASTATRDLADPPTITFDRRRHWVDVAPAARRAGDAPGLPGRHTEVAGDPVRHTWRGDAGPAALPFLADHRVHDEAVLPGAAFHALALSAACEVFARAAPTRCEVNDLRFRELLRLADRTEVSTTVTVTAPDRAECEIFARGDGRRLGAAGRRGAALRPVHRWPIRRRAGRATTRRRRGALRGDAARGASSTARRSPG